MAPEAQVTTKKRRPEQILRFHEDHEHIMDSYFELKRQIEYLL